MSYLSALTNAGAPLAKPPEAKPLGAPPHPTHADMQTLAQRAEPPAYDVTKDANWAGIVHPEDHQLQGVLNNMSPEDRQVLQMRLHQLISAATGGGPKPPVAPPAAPLPPQAPAAPPQAPPSI